MTQFQCRNQWQLQCLLEVSSTGKSKISSINLIIKLKYLCLKIKFIRQLASAIIIFIIFQWCITSCQYIYKIVSTLASLFILEAQFNHKIPLWFAIYSFTTNIFCFHLSFSFSFIQFNHDYHCCQYKLFHVNVMQYNEMQCNW